MDVGGLHPRCVRVVDLQAARALDHKDRWLLALDEDTGKTRVVAHDHDDAWLDGPGSDTLGWMKGDEAIYF